MEIAPSTSAGTPTIDVAVTANAPNRARSKRPGAMPLPSARRNVPRSRSAAKVAKLNMSAANGTSSCVISATVERPALDSGERS